MRQLKLTLKAWNKFDYESQVKILQKYDVILLDHSTKSQKIIKILRKFNNHNLNQGIKKFNDGVDALDHTMDDLSKSLNKGYGRDERPIKEQFWGKS